MKIPRREHVPDQMLEEAVPDPVLRQLLARRGVKDATECFCELKDLLHFQDLKNISKAASLIAEAIVKGSRILVAGDYDVDGLTGTALGVRGLRALGASYVSRFVPSRYDGGYGLSIEAVDRFIETENIDFIITPDNGISCNEAIAYAKERGLTVVVTDHHETLDVLPGADVIVDPKQPGDEFESKNLCGVGVLFYVLCAVKAELIDKGFYKDKSFVPNLSEFLDLVALGTIGDVVPLDANNRRLVKAGFRRLRDGRCAPGIIALAQVARIKLHNLTTVNISFDLCPRLNAAGRIQLEDNPAADLLLTDDFDKALELAARLDMCNRRRGDFERVALSEAKEDAQAQKGKSAITLYRPSWLSGIGGLLAGRIKDTFNVPCFVFSGDGEIISGSARSVPGFGVAQLLQRIDTTHPGLLIRYGGHAMAAGASIKRTDLDLFRDVFNEEARLCTGGPQECEILSDGLLPSNYLNLAFALDLEKAGPWGNGFPEPLFDGEFIVEKAELLTARHLRLVLISCADGAVIRGIRLWASTSEKAIAEGMRVTVAYTLAVNRYSGANRLEIHIESISPI